ncbi:tRNA intron catalytic C-terminal domain-containing protein [Cryptosporidium andersoni]|uniref:tRNA-intron lyase n=1 Tax=Cryptosporidium andersoni TaxID=117008 RepID=A0A1J4MTM2_9CRYT|nr:tRNA intron catalytic C-terminal domain-containing protein [Cryptosporidium andersoni]
MSQDCGLSKITANIYCYDELKAKKIITYPIGHIPRKCQNKNGLGLPLGIMKFQDSLVSLSGEEFKKVGTTDEYEVVANDLFRNYNYYVLEGSKYGCDFKIYDKDPDFNHSIALVHVVTEPFEVSVDDMILWQRLAHSVNKKMMIAMVSKKTNSCNKDDYIKSNNLNNKNNHINLSDTEFNGGMAEVKSDRKLYEQINMNKIYHSNGVQLIIPKDIDNTDENDISLQSNQNEYNVIDSLEYVWEIRYLTCENIPLST